MKRLSFVMLFVAVLIPSMVSAQVEAVPISIEITEACPLTVGYAYKTVDHPGVYYIAEGCKKRPMLSSAVFFSYFASWSDVAVVPEATLEAIDMHELGFLPWGPRRAFADGSLIKTTDDPRVYLILGSRAYPFDSGDVFEELGYRYPQIEDVDPRVFDALDRRDAIARPADVPEGVLFVYPDSPDVYVLERDGETDTVKKRKIMSMEDVEALGYRPDRIAILPIDVDFINGGVVDVDEQATDTEVDQAADDTYVAPNSPERYHVDFSCPDIVSGGDGTYALCIGKEFSHTMRTFGFKALTRADHSSYIQITRISDVASVEVGDQVLVSDTVEQTAARLFDEDTRITIRYVGKDLAGKVVYTIRQRPL